jgi:hypothetical protein
MASYIYGVEKQQIIYKFWEEYICPVFSNVE